MNKDYKLLEQFQSVIKEHFGAPAQSVDFTAEETCGKINSWVQEFTHGKIQGILPKGIRIEKSHRNIWDENRKLKLAIILLYP